MNNYRDPDDEYTWARFAQAYEQPWPEDHPRCEYCGEHLTDDEQDHEGPNELCSEHRTDDQQTEQQQPREATNETLQRNH